MRQSWHSHPYGTLTPSQNNCFDFELLTKNAARRARFLRDGKTTQCETCDRDYFTGNDSEFQPVIRALEDKELSSNLGGPQMRTWQLERTTRQHGS